MKIKNKILVFFYLILIVNFTIKDLHAENPIYKLSAIKVSYKDNNQIIIAEGEAYAIDQFGKEIFSDFIIYDKSKNIIRTKNNSRYKDTKGNKIDAESFFYDLNINKIIAKNKVRYEEIKGNIFYFSEFEYFENSGKGFGKNVKSLMTDKSSFESEYLEIDNNLGTLVINSNQKKISFFGKIKSLFSKDNKYTTCENIKNSPNIKDQCPDWSLSTFQTKHDSNKKMIYHDHAIIKIRNVPVFYTPYFSHPDPTVDRKSGFLAPSTKNFSDLGRTFKTPYFWAIDKNTDVTFTPIFYEDENSIFLSNLKKQFKNSLINLDTSYSRGYKNLNKLSNKGEKISRTDGSRNHLFLNFQGSYDDIIYDKNDITINIQRISQKNYLNVNQINTDLVKQDIASLVNSININSYENRKKLSISGNVFENLNIDDRNTKYQYKIPQIQFDNFSNIFDQNVNFSNLFEFNNLEGDSKQTIQTNKIQTNSNGKIIKKIGINNLFYTKLDNINTYNENVLGAEENLNKKVYTTVAIESSLPLIRLNKKTEEILIPKIFTKFTEGSMRDMSSENKILQYSDIYSLDRLNNTTNPETGGSIGYGIEHQITKKNINNDIYLKNNFSIGQILKNKKSSKFPTNSSLNDKASNIIGSYNLDFNNFLESEYINKNNITNIDFNNGFKFNYDFNLSNNLNTLLRNQINSSYKSSNNLFSFEFYELNQIGNTRHFETNYTRTFKEYFNFGTGLRKNLKSNYTESNYIEANYESDCLKFGINLSKQFYQQDDLKRSNNLTFFINLKPFGKPFSPDLTNLVNN